MPFQSKSQQRFMFSQHPKIAERWAHETPNIKKLPEHKKKKVGNYSDSVVKKAIKTRGGEY